MRLCVRQSQTSLNPLGLNMQLSSLEASMCLALSNVTQLVRFQYVAIPTQRVYVSVKLNNQCICELSVCSYLHSTRLCVRQSPIQITL
ncbi:unnamed protein product [Ectocarpus sp. CCAP 1310/34]|nr:unnamed protein product [Ectocarpus sp. CCAP 1310/34]